MSMTNVRSYFRTHLKAKGFTEWVNGFDDDNIPNTKLDKIFHLHPIQVTGVATLNQAIQFKARQVVIVIFKGYADPPKSIDTAILQAENLIQELMLTSSRASQTFQNLTLRAIKIERAAKDTDDSKMTMDFEADVFLDI